MFVALDFPVAINSEIDRTGLRHDLYLGFSSFENMLVLQKYENVVINEMLLKP